MNVFETSHLKKSYGKKAVLKDVNLTVREGEIYGLIGKKRRRQDNSYENFAWTHRSNRRRNQNQRFKFKGRFGV